MKITNEQRLPKAVVHAVTTDRYEAGDGDVSCTTLIAPAQAFQLTNEHKDEIVEDAVDRIWSMMGSAVHYVLENAVMDLKAKGEYTDKHISERRFYWTVGGKRISAQIDLYEDGELNDFKLTSVWAIKDAVLNGKDDWTAQLNIQRYLMVKNDLPVDKLFIVAIARDWNRSGALRDPQYPPRAVRINIPVWSMEKTEAYIQTRINALYSPVPVLCTPDECWESPSKYVLMKKGRKSALRVMESEDQAIGYATENNWTTMEPTGEKDAAGFDVLKPVLLSAYYVEVRPGERKRCQGYCDAAPFCQQWMDWKQENIDQKIEDANAKS